MIPPGRTTLYRMQTAAHNEAQRIEISQDGMVTLGWQKAPAADQIKLRDDFAGIVRMIDAIEADRILKERVMAAMAKDFAPPPAPIAAAAADMQMVPVDEETADT